MELWALYTWHRNCLVISDSCRAIKPFFMLIVLAGKGSITDSSKSKMYNTFKCTSVLNYQRLTKFVVIPSLLQLTSFISDTDCLFPEPHSNLSVLDYD